jgi:hypothetical protein
MNSLKKLRRDLDNFSFAQMTSNSDGKTSGSGTMGVLICVFGSLCFTLGCFDTMLFSKTADIITQSIVFTGIGAGLLGYRKSKDNAPKEVIVDEVAPAEVVACDCCPEGCECGDCKKCSPK